jgi:hypothetical protein
MAKSKEISSKKASFAKGGSTKMFGKQHAGTQKPGQTSTQATSSGKFAVGGKTHMFGKQCASPSKAGKTNK